MGRSSGVSWKDYLAIGAAIAVAFGIHSAWRRMKNNGAKDDATTAMRPSDFKTKTVTVAKPSQEHPGDAVAAANPEAFAEKYVSPGINEPMPYELGHRDPASRRQGSNRARLADTFGSVSLAKNGVCQSAERVGPGPERVNDSPEEWTRVLDIFHGAKDSLVRWLKTEAKNIPAETVAMMEQQVKTLRIRRPPSIDEPDFSWRGSAVLSMDDTGLPIVHVGGGYFSLLSQNAARAKFELARVVSQVWSPCELARVGAADPWGGLTSCLGVSTSSEERACADGTYSEAGWAISTTVAARVADPGCKIPALSDPVHAACLTQTLGAGRSVASTDSHGEH